MLFECEHKYLFEHELELGNFHVYLCHVDFFNFSLKIYLGMVLD